MLDLLAMRCYILSIASTHATGETFMQPEDFKRTRYSWKAMRSRCERSKDPSFCRYGARGITVCERWKKSFANFLADMGVRPVGTTIDRVDGSGNYEPANCRWATRAEQEANRRPYHATVFVEFNGRRQSTNAWITELGLGKNTLTRRLAAGWPIEKAILTPGHKARQVAS